MGSNSRFALSRTLHDKLRNVKKLIRSSFYQMNFELQSLFYIWRCNNKLMKLYLTYTYTVFTQNAQENLSTVSSKRDRFSSLDYIGSGYVKILHNSLDLVFISVFFLKEKLQHSYSTTAAFNRYRKRLLT